MTEEREKCDQIPEHLVQNEIELVSLEQCNNPEFIKDSIERNETRYFILYESSDRNTAWCISSQKLALRLLKKIKTEKGDFQKMQVIEEGVQVKSFLDLAYRQEESARAGFIGFKKNETFTGIMPLNNSCLSALIKRESDGQLIEELSKQISQKDDFLSIVCHDLRNPLGVISACVDYIIDDKESNQQVRQHIDFLKRIKGNVNKTSEMINNLLDMSRIKSTGSNLKLERTFLPEYLREIQQNLQLLASKRQIKIDIPDDCENLYANLDPPRFCQIIENLVVNAIKFSPKNTTITINCNKYGSSESGLNLLSINIIDQGYGIPDEKVKTLFNIFEQGESEQDIKSTGFGIGLFIVKQFTHLHDGRIEVKNNSNGQGSTFSIVVPEAVNKFSDREGKRVILLVEDDDDVIEFVQLALEKLDFKVIPATNGIEAAKLFRQEKNIDLVLSDLRLPGKDGFELLQEIKNIDPGTPYVLMTGFYENIHDHHAKTFFKADKILHKPFTNEDLEDCLIHIFPTPKSA